MICEGNNRMKDLQILFCILSLFAGVASLSISALLYKLHKKRALLILILLNLSLFLIQAAISLNLYAASTVGSHSDLLFFSKLLDVIGTSSSSLFGLFLVHALFGKDVSPLKMKFFLFVFALQLAGVALSTFAELTLLKSIVRASMLLVIAYEIAFLAVNYKQIHSKELKRTIKTFALITLAFFPLFALEAFRPQINGLREVEALKMLALPAFFFVANLCFLYLAVTYFNSPAFMKNGKVTPYFTQKYAVTKKEAEVIELLIAGLTYSEISDQLFIAKKTVDNHVQNIYKKLEVTNKIQLLNLVRSKE